MGGTMQHQPPHYASKDRLLTSGAYAGHAPESGSGASRLRHIMRRPEAAEYIGRSVRALERWATEGGGPKFVRIGAKAVGYRTEDLDAWLKARTFSSTSEEDAARSGKAA